MNFAERLLHCILCSELESSRTVWHVLGLALVSSSLDYKSDCVMYKSFSSISKFQDV